MKVHVQSVNFKADQKLIDFIQARMDKLDLFYDRIVDSEVFLKVDNNHSKENKIVEIRLKVPGNEMVVTKECASFEEACDVAAESLSRQLKKHKEKVRGI